MRRGLPEPGDRPAIVVTGPVDLRVAAAPKGSSTTAVIPLEKGIQERDGGMRSAGLDSHLRGNDGLLWFGGVVGALGVSRTKSIGLKKGTQCGDDTEDQSPTAVIPLKKGIQKRGGAKRSAGLDSRSRGNDGSKGLDSRLRGNDGLMRLHKMFGSWRAARSASRTAAVGTTVCSATRASITTVARRRRRTASDRPANEGVALILTLLFVVLLTVLVVEFAYEAQVEASYALNSGNEFQAELAARSAIYNGIAILDTDRIEADLVASEGGSNADSRLSVWAAPGTFDPLNDAVMRTTITDEFSKINLNALVYYDEGGNPLVRGHIQAALIYFFQQRDESINAEALVDSIIDWVDEDGDLYDDGAETDFYQSAENPYPCKNGPMDSIEELLLIKGITPELYFGRQDVEPIQLPLSEYLTVHGDWLGRINPNTVYVDYDTGISEVLEAMAEGWINPTDGPQLATNVDVEGIITIVADVQNSEPFGAVGDLSQYVDVAPDALPEADTRRSNQNSGQQATGNQQQDDDVLRNMFTVYSHIFRIQGDALLDDILVRNEAYVYRVPQDDGRFELPNQLVGTNPVPLQVPAPEEYYRILEWKVIQ